MKKDNFKEIPETKKILKRMCKVVGANFDNINFKSPEWFYKYEWTEEEQNKFNKWLCKEFYNNKKLRVEALAHPIKDKQMIKKAVDFFVLDLGWKLKDEK